MIRRLAWLDVGNHDSTLETVALPVLLRVLSPLTFVVFARLLEVPVFKRVFNTIGTKLAVRTAVPIIPMAVQTSAWLMGGPFGYLGRIDPAQIARMADSRSAQVSRPRRKR